MELQRFFVVVPFLNFGATQKRIVDFDRAVEKLQTQASPAAIIIVECVLAGAMFAVTSSANPFHIQVKCASPMYLKENLINLAVAKLPPGWKYVAWVDERVEFQNANWVRDTVDALRRWKAVQLFDRSNAMDEEGKTTTESLGLVRRHLQKTLLVSPDKLSVICPSVGGESSASSNIAFKNFTEANCKLVTFGETEGEPGVAWATTRKVWERIGGLFELAICGSGDTYMGYSVLGEAEKKCIGQIVNKKYKEAAAEWTERVGAVIHRSVGYIKGSVMIRRGAEEEGSNKILNECEFDPEKDIKKDLQGLNMFANPQSALATRIARYIKACKHK